MAKSKNSYQKAAQKKALSGTGNASTGEKMKDAATELGKDIVVGVIGGGVAGADRRMEGVPHGGGAGGRAVVLPGGAGVGGAGAAWVVA